ncbi:uncharacterized protein F5891DRAFT_1181324 [Suillus fuscotomentosus]|uniref:AB hydrolase-1 domain-containing protein n=1 Tax=Suillus fuscotomentosus TaxID=1912939 RepID=A0AAD4EL55_9AGAM|nr:uncharacterized protein F5891DRAFT_1181324 [Suillus fuscotomentosus]KAG1907023.1 hypothetical protein F5891DRAFT_1181324 [Suillus fuscotomentosus]
MSSGDSPSEDKSADSLAVIKQLPTDLLLIVFIHGFKGTDTTFKNFPSRLEHVLTEVIENLKVECIVFPAYETKGQLMKTPLQNAAVEHFADWLTTLTVQREVADGQGGGAGKTRVVLCGHSMGGLLAADALLAFVNSRPDKNAPLWPNIIACIAFDTPYLGLHPTVFKNSATKAVEYAGAARTVVSDVFSLFGKKGASSTVSGQPPLAIAAAPTEESGWAKWAPAAYAVGGALVAGAAAGTAYYRRDDIGSGYSWATDHMNYVRNLWDEEALRKRMRDLVDVQVHLGVTFHSFYTLLPPAPPSFSSPRTFVILPQRTSPIAAHFLPARNHQAADEVQAHTNMFNPRFNDGYYQLGLDTAKIIREAVMSARGIIESDDTEAQKDVEAAAAMEETLPDQGESDAKP